VSLLIENVGCIFYFTRFRRSRKIGRTARARIRWALRAQDHFEVASYSVAESDVPAASNTVATSVFAKEMKHCTPTGSNCEPLACSKCRTASSNGSPLRYGREETMASNALMTDTIRETIGISVSLGPLDNRCRQNSRDDAGCRVRRVQSLEGCPGLPSHIPGVSSSEHSRLHRGAQVFEELHLEFQPCRYRSGPAR